MSALPMDYAEPAPQEVGPSIQDIIDGDGGGCFPQPVEPGLPFGLPPLTDIWSDDPWGGGGCFGEPSPWPGLPYDLFGEDNGPSSSAGMFGGVGDFIRGAAEKVGRAAGGGGVADYDGGGGCLPYQSPFEDMIVY